MFTSTPPSFLSLWFFLFWEGMTNDLSSYGINRQKLCVVSKVMSNILPLLLLYFINDQSCSYFFYYTPVYLLIFCTDIFISRYLYIWIHPFCHILYFKYVTYFCIKLALFLQHFLSFYYKCTCIKRHVIPFTSKNDSTYGEMGYRTQPPILRYTQVTVWPSGLIARSLSGR